MADYPVSPSADDQRRALLALLCVQLLFGTLPVAGKLAIPIFGPGGIGFFRIVGGAIAFQVLRLAFREKPVPWRDQPMLILCSMLGITANQLFYLYGLKHTTAVNATLIVTLVPVMTYGVALLLGREHWDRWRVAGIVAGIGGVATLVAKDVGGGEFIGDVLIFLNTASYAAYLVVSRPILARHSPLSVVAWLFTWSVPVTCGVVGLPPLPGLGELLPNGVPVWLVLAYIVAGPTVGTYYLNLYALRSVPSSTVALFIYLQPFITTAAAVALIGESPGIREAVAAIIAFAGVWMATRPPRHPAGGGLRSGP